MNIEWIGKKHPELEQLATQHNFFKFSTWFPIRELFDSDDDNDEEEEEPVGA